MLERCAATVCDHDADVWAYNPSIERLVPACISHHIDVTAGGVEIDRSVPTLDAGGRSL